MAYKRLDSMAAKREMENNGRDDHNPTEMQLCLQRYIWTDHHLQIAAKLIHSEQWQLQLGVVYDFRLFKRLVPQTTSSQSDCNSLERVRDYSKEQFALV